MDNWHSEDNIQAIITEDIIDLSIEESETSLSIQADGIPTGGTKDYQKLKNKPSINGTELFDNYNEIDPTVPNWAKEDTKPKYDVDEITDALDQNDEMTFAEIKDVFDLVFNN